MCLGSHRAISYIVIFFLCVIRTGLNGDSVMIPFALTLFFSLSLLILSRAFSLSFSTQIYYLGICSWRLEDKTTFRNPSEIFPPPLELCHSQPFSTLLSLSRFTKRERERERERRFEKATSEAPVKAEKSLFRVLRNILKTDAFEEKREREREREKERSRKLQSERI